MSIAETTPKKVHIGGSGSGPNGREVTIRGLSKDDQDAMEAMICGECWVRLGDDGRIERRSRFEPQPSPEQDPLIPPKWYGENLDRLWLTVPAPKLDDEPDPKHHFPAITVQHLCGYNNMPYEAEAQKLQEYGFECLRSRRGPNGRFWEVWQLPGLYAAKGRLKEALARHVSTAESLRAAIDFLCRHVSFGTLNVCYQRACMVVD